MVKQLTVRRLPSAESHSISAVFDHKPGREIQLRTTANVDLAQTATPWLPPAASSAMRRSRQVLFVDAVDSRALVGATKAQEVLSSWYPRQYRRTEVATPALATDGPPRGGVGCFFSGGVDSFYSALTHHERITHLIFVVGFDIDPDDETTARTARMSAREAAADLGKPLLEVTTDVRRLGRMARISWGRVFHGATLAHVALALSPQLGTVIVPSSDRHDQLGPWGSHPDLDPCWSSSAVSIEHDRVDVDRLDKTRVIATSPIAMGHLRVCWKSTGTDLNCGRCSKCVRTMLGLHLAGVRSSAFAGGLSPHDVRRVRLMPSELDHTEAVLTALQNESPKNSELTEALATAVARSRRARRFTFAPFH